jgi:cytochrome c
MKLFCRILFVLIIFSACKDTKNGSKSARPLESWVFRSVLDGRPRMLSIALDKNMCLSYNTQTASLYKAWDGLVYFDGAVYSEAHGPQPISIGNAYMQNADANPWIFINGQGDSTSAKVNYKGHTILNDKLSIQYELVDITNNNTAFVNEEVDSELNGKRLLKRKFKISELKSTSQLALKTTISSIAVQENISTNAKIKILSKVEREVGVDKKSLDIVALILLGNGSSNLDITFMNEASILNSNIAGASQEDAEEGEVVHPGLTLIGKSNCKTCHNKNRKTVGPSYVDIAKKYDGNENTIKGLVSKVKNGGSGIWGNVAMTAHEDTPESDIRSMVEYILSLDTEVAKVTEVKTYNFDNLVGLDTQKLLPGAKLKVYSIPTSISSMPDFKKLKIIQAGIKNNFAGMEGGDFVGLSDNFGFVSDGFLNVKVAGDYVLETVSDDGSFLYLNDSLIINNDGNHGPESKQVNVKLAKGQHKFKLLYYQGGGGRYLSLNWAKVGQELSPISAADISHLPNDGEDLSKFNLPMASASKIPGHKSNLTDVHPSFDLAQARPNDFKPKVGGMDFKKDGSMIISTWESTGSIWRLENIQTGDPSKIKVTKIASGLAEPLGVKVVDDTIYVMQKQELTKLVDLNSDGLIDQYITVCDDWLVSANFHEFGFGLEYKEGFFFATLATAINPGGASTDPQIKDRGKVVKINRFTGKHSFIASGLRTPNGIGFGYKGELFVADNQGDWLPSSKILHITEGSWYGSRSVDPIASQKWIEKPPVVWLPQDEIGNSPSQPTTLDVGPYKGQMIHGEVTHGGIKRVFVDEVEGQLQGAVFNFCQGLEAGVNRMKWGPDGALYVGGIGNPGNWSQSGKGWFGLQKLTFNNKVAFEMLAVRAKANGIEIEFTEPISNVEVINKNAFEIKQWYYKPTIEYGGPKLGETKLNVSTISLDKDKKKLFLELPSLKAGHVVYININEGLISTTGQNLWTSEAWYTMNKMSKEIGIVQPWTEVADNTLSALETQQGWKLLFDGKNINGFRNYKKSTIGSGWVINENAIHLNAQKVDGKWQSKDGGDIITTKPYQDYELKLDWKISNCGNSGIIFNVVESKEHDYVWQTGPEMQILDNVCHPDTRFVTHRAGDLYDMIESKYPIAKPAGQWNKVILKNIKGKVDFYLNGFKIVSFKTSEDNWKKMIAKSKFKDMRGFGLSSSGHIALQDHGDKVWFKNIKIKTY